MAEVIRSLAVPASLELEAGTKFLGKVPDSFWRLRVELDISGYPDADEIKTKLMEVLEIE